jgi:hypothetical protein
MWEVIKTVNVVVSALAMLERTLSGLAALLAGTTMA